MRSVRARLTLAAVVLATGAAASACGGDDRLSQEELHQQANAICAKYDAKINALGSPTSATAIPDYVRRVVPLIRQALTELHALKPPADLEGDYDRMLDETAKTIPAAQSLADAAEKGNAAGVQDALAATRDAYKASNSLATDLGLDECAAQ